MKDRAEGCLLGLAVGDAMGAPAENLTAEEIAARWGTITGFLTDSPSGTDDTEYAAFSALLLLEHGHALTSDHVADAWIEHLAGREGGFPGAGFSELGTIENLRAGLRPPASGRHLHSWSDGLAMRAAVHGIYAVGDPAGAARLATIDGVVSHDGEGIHAGVAVAAAVAVAMTGTATPREIGAAALAAVPADSWTARSLRVALDRAGDLPGLLDAVVVRAYPWTDLAPEAVALAFAAFLAADGDLPRSVTGAVAMGRDADTTAAIAGALAGAHGGLDAVPADWRAQIGPVTGRCLGEVVAGLHPIDLADRLAAHMEAPS
ncbi:ADP-ribosylglycohydrolase family protein [Jiangella asiatica]|uniref:ADP-ribosylglycohydrolase family protein n=1 Tax=Jiangella asiatica TaxID=2530372 RepID=A0A4R5CMF1_9ACTN|nr:ADP-ribosylglycohydrolase family protein [Jiangella asiatica]TDE00400.1 ADP-ribosylglycohydrolase family protein [Jiangella asiatica]